MSKKLSKNVKEMISSLIMIISTFIIVFNNVGQSLQLIQIPIGKIAMYWIAGFAFISGMIWTLYLNKILKL